MRAVVIRERLARYRVRIRFYRVKPLLPDYSDFWSRKPTFEEVVAIFFVSAITGVVTASFLVGVVVGLLMSLFLS